MDIKNIWDRHSTIVLGVAFSVCLLLSLLSGKSVLPVFGMLFAIAVYLLPTLVAGRRRKENPAPTIVVNLFLGWTFIGWVVALAMAVSGPTLAGEPAP